MRPSRLFLIAASLLSQLNLQPFDSDATRSVVSKNLASAISGIHSIDSALRPDDQPLIAKAFNLLDPKKGRFLFTSFTSGDLIVSSLLKRMGKIPTQMGEVPTRIVLDCFKAVGPRLVEGSRVFSSDGEVDPESYAYLVLVPAYKICEGRAGKVVSDVVEQLGQEICDGVRSVLGQQTYLQVYGRIGKDVKAKRDRRKQDEKVMVVTNPVRSAKRKLRIAAKSKANKRRKIMSLKLARWMR